MDDILREFRAKAELSRRRSEGLPEDYVPEKRPRLKPAFKGEELPGGFPTQASTPFFTPDPGIHPGHAVKKADEYYGRYQNAAPETVERLLTEKEEAFCQIYAITRNGAASARAAGWKPSSAYNTAYRLLLKNTIRQRITHLMQFHQFNDQATPAHALALVMSALQGGPDPDFRLRAARIMLDIYKVSGASPVSKDQDQAALAPLRSGQLLAEMPESPQAESNVLNNNTFIQINGLPSPQVSTPPPQVSTDLNALEADSPQPSTPPPNDLHKENASVDQPDRQETGNGQRATGNFEAPWNIV